MHLTVSKSGFMTKSGLHLIKNRFGQKIYAFVRPKYVFYSTSTYHKLILLNDRMDDYLFDTSGDLFDWKVKIATAAVKNTRLMFAISAAFSSLILAFDRKYTGGGFHFYPVPSKDYDDGGDTESNLLRVAATVFGKGVMYNDDNNGFIDAWSNDPYNLRSLFTGFIDSSFCIDTLETGKDDDVLKIMNYFKTYRSLLLSSGTLSLKEKIGKKLYMDKYSDIFIDVPYDPTLYSKSIAEDCQKYYGIASIEFIKNMMHDTHKLERYLDNRLNEIKDYLNVDDVKYEKIVHRVALAVCGGLLAAKYNIVSWEKKQIYKCGRDCLRDIINNN